MSLSCFFLNDAATTEIYTLSLHDALPIFDGLKVGERAAQPALGDVERPAALRLRLEDVLELFLGADEQDVLTLQHHPAEQLLRGLDLAQRSEEHTSELQSLTNLVCRLLLEK